MPLRAQTLTGPDGLPKGPMSGPEVLWRPGGSMESWGPDRRPEGPMDGPGAQPTAA